MDPEIQKILSSIIGVLLTVMLGILTYAISRIKPLIEAWIDAKVELLLSNLNKEQLFILDQVVIKAIREAEQRADIDEIINTALAKKEFALKSVQEELDRLGIPFDIFAADKAIEAAINQNLEQAPLTITSVTTELKPNE